MDILQTLAQSTRERYRERERIKPLEQLMAETGACKEAAPPPRFAEALARPGLSVICEIKKASPSKGTISPTFPYLTIAKEYEAGGGDAISVLTEPTRFLGNDRYLSHVASFVSLPVLRKDFILGPYQIHEAKLLGASAVLLICALLSDRMLATCLATCRELDLDALVEVHDEEEAGRAVAVGARIIGVNNRNLRTFDVDLQTSFRLRDLIPPSVLFVSESGIETAADAASLAAHGTDAILVGERLMRSEDKKRTIGALKNR
jgi:indole-3-glycerol phosphate synthase